MKHSTKTYLLWLPMMAMLAVGGWVVLGALPGVSVTGDLIAWLMELPVLTCFALAIGGAALSTMQITGMNLENDYRRKLVERAPDGDNDAFRVLCLESVQWFVFLAFWLTLFWPGR
jgi:hypothetical protein